MPVLVPVRRSPRTCAANKPEVADRAAANSGEDAEVSVDAAVDARDTSDTPVNTSPTAAAAGTSVDTPADEDFPWEGQAKFGPPGQLAREKRMQRRGRR